MFYDDEEEVYNQEQDVFLEIEYDVNDYMVFKKYQPEKTEDFYYE